MTERRARLREAELNKVTEERYPLKLAIECLRATHRPNARLIDESALEQAARKHHEEIAFACYHYVHNRVWSGSPDLRVNKKSVLQKIELMTPSQISRHLEIIANSAKTLHTQLNILWEQGMPSGNDERDQEVREAFTALARQIDLYAPPGIAAVDGQVVRSNKHLLTIIRKIENRARNLSKQELPAARTRLSLEERDPAFWKFYNRLAPIYQDYTGRQGRLATTARHGIDWHLPFPRMLKVLFDHMRERGNNVQYGQ